MANKEYHFVQDTEISALNQFFQNEKSSIRSFGSKVNQTFEAYIFASVIKWYQTKGWKITYRHPVDIHGSNYFRLKFSTRGSPGKYSYVVAERNTEIIQIHHQLRVETKSHKINRKYKANICCDVAIIKESQEVGAFGSDDAIENSQLLSFGEAKHMSAYAELIAGFIGMVHELKPDRLRRLRVKGYLNGHLPPFLFVSGILYSTGKGIDESLERRKFDIDIYSFDQKMNV